MRLSVLLYALCYSLQLLLNAPCCAVPCLPPHLLQVKPRTESGRDSMLRAGLSAALSAAQEGRNSLLGGDEPTRLAGRLWLEVWLAEWRAAWLAFWRPAS
jgi:hypothetical protein